MENLATNYETFDACKSVFRQQGIVLIFSEGKCINEWHLRKLKKGTARLAFSSWDENIPLAVLPVGINYSSFRRFGKNIHINFGEVMTAGTYQDLKTDGERYQAFNQQLTQQLSGLVWEISKSDREKQAALLEHQPSSFQTFILALPAMIVSYSIGRYTGPLQRFTFKKANHNDHFDSVLSALLIFLYPFYLVLLTRNLLVHHP